MTNQVIKEKQYLIYNYISCVYLKCYQLSLKSIDSSSNLFFYLNIIYNKSWAQTSWLRQVASSNCRNFNKFLDFKNRYIHIFWINMTNQVMKEKQYLIYNYINCVYLKCYQLSLKSIDSSSDLFFFFFNYIIMCNKKTTQYT